MCYQPPGGESFHEFANRCLEVIETLASRHSGKNIVAVTHGGVLGAIFRKILNIGLDAERNFLLRNCSINQNSKDSRSMEPCELG